MFCQRETRYSVLDYSDYQVLCVLSKERLVTPCSILVTIRYSVFCQRETRYSVLDSSDYQVLCVLSRRETRYSVFC